MKRSHFALFSAFLFLACPGTPPLAAEPTSLRASSAPKAASPQTLDAAREARTRGDKAAAERAYRDALKKISPADPLFGAAAEELAFLLSADARHREVAELLSPLPGLVSPEARRLLAEALEAEGRNLEAICAFVAAEAATDATARDEIAVRTRAAIDRLSEKDLATLARLRPFTRHGGYAALRLARTQSAGEGEKKSTLRYARLAFLFPGDTVGQSALAALNDPPPAAPAPSTKAKPGNFGLLLPLSGRLAPLGEKVLRGAMLGFHLLAGDSAEGIAVHLADTESDPAVAPRAVESLATRGVVGIIGPLKGDVAQAAAKTSRSLGVPLLTITPLPDVAGAGVFRLNLREEDEVDALVRHAMQRLGIRRFAILAPDNEQGRLYRKLFWDAAVRHSAEIDGSELFASGENTSFETPIAKLAGTYAVSREELRRRFEEERLANPALKDDFSKYKSRPQVDFGAVFIPAPSLTAAQIAPQFPYYDVSNVVLLGIRTWNYAGLVQVGKQYVEGARFPTEWTAATPEGQAFSEAYQSAYGEPPGVLEAYGYDAARLFLEAWRQGGAGSRADLARTLSRLSDIPAVTGPLTTAPNGDIAVTPKMLTVERQQIVPVSTPEAAQ